MPPSLTKDLGMAGGRPSKFNDALKAEVMRLAKEGKTDIEIVQAVGVSERSLNNWKKKNPEFMQSLKESKSVADEMVEVSLFHRAIGYSHPAVKMFYDKEKGEVIEHKYTEHYPPSEVAAIFWLKNRQPERWRDKQEHEHTVNVSRADRLRNARQRVGKK